MSTIAEHLAAMELHKTLGDHEQFYSEVYLFTQVHWAELIAQQDPAEMQRARVAIEARMVDQHGDRAAPFIEQWRVARPVGWRDSTPHLNVGNSAFEAWFQDQPFATQPGIKQISRDSYAAGMGDPLVIAAAPATPKEQA